jgi:hypothetical protein
MTKVENTESKKPKKEKKAKEPKQAEFPVKGFINAYGFIHLPKSILSAFGLGKGDKTSITIDLQDNALIIRKA